MEIEVLYVDNHLLVVDKPACLPVVPDSSQDPSLLEGAKAWVKRTYGKPGKVFLGVVHRIDRPVSGCVLFARTSKAAARLSAAFKARQVEKTYWGVSERPLLQAEGSLEQWLRKDAQRNRVEVVGAGTPGAKLAHSLWRVLGARGDRTWVELRPLSGRSHQLRVAMGSLDAPLAGDLKYGASTPLPDQSIALHARSLELDHPVGGRSLRFESEPPAGRVWQLVRGR